MATLVAAPLRLVSSVVRALNPIRSRKGGGRDDDVVIEYDDAYEQDQQEFNLSEYEHLAAPFPIVDERDAKTPDAWVKRHPDLVRLTGKHPFNVEAQLPQLIDYGWVSPVNLHFVRNHGAVPVLKWSEHTITVKGNVDKIITVTMDELASMRTITFPCFMACAGNRRKEQNQIKQSIGFNWGPCAVGNTYWTGVPLREVLKKAGVTKPGPGRRFVCFAGPQKELPRSYENQQGGPGSYGSSIDMETALDPSCDVILAIKQNGKELHPDHGYPVRLLLPGYIGGRTVKWLTEIEVTDKESDNFYHFNDNRVLPPMVDAEKANAEKWWFKPEYIINNININGAIAYPWHNEIVDSERKSYTIKGYAYSGGGRKIIRVEISLDGGMTWRLAPFHTKEKPRWAAGSSGDHAKHWCWFLWELDVTVSEMAEAKEIIFRAWDQSQNSMPERPTWNVMGMLNNPWYRVRVHKEGSMLRFEHPTQAGPDKEEGWMVNMANKAGGHLNWGWGGSGTPAAA
ncbi:nitrate reductase [Pseudoscourfieldia marina]